MLANIDFAKEQKLALLLAMNVPNNIIVDRLNISENTLKAYKSDEDFIRLIDLYKNELETDKLMAKVKNNDSMLDYYVKRKLMTLVDILDQDLDFIHESLRENKDVWEAKDFINGVNSVTNLANVIRQLLRDVAWVANDTQRVDIERQKADIIDDSKKNVLTPEVISQIKNIVRSSKEGA
jgi:hypothetical protein